MTECDTISSVLNPFEPSFANAVCFLNETMINFFSALDWTLLSYTKTYGVASHKKLDGRYRWLYINRPFNGKCDTSMNCHRMRWFDKLKLWELVSCELLHSTKTTEINSVSCYPVGAINFRLSLSAVSCELRLLYAVTWVIETELMCPSPLTVPQ